MEAAAENTAVEIAHAADAAAAPESLFVTVPETTLPNGLVVPAFQVARYLSSISDDDQLVISATEKPAAYISYHAARELAEKAGYQLIRETQALALAYNISQQAANWTGGAVGEGKLKQGLRFSADEAMPGDFVPDSKDEDRWFVLSNGERICDGAGCLFTWVFDDVQGDENGVIARAFTPESPSVSTSPYESREKGAGWQPSKTAEWSGDALIRGGCWCSDDNAGVFYLGGGWPGGEGGNVGFRCTKGL